MCHLHEWEEEMRRTLESGSHTRRRTARILRGPASEGDSVWSREDTRAVDEQGNVQMWDMAQVANGVCGCVLTQKTGQVICRECRGVVCSDHTLECQYCHGLFCPAHAVAYGTDENRVAYCQHHRIVHYLKLFLGIKDGK